MGMHTFRLLDMALDIAKFNRIVVKRENREELLSVKAGNYGYDELISIAEAKLETVEKAFENTDLPDEPDANALVVQMREALYCDNALYY